MKIAVFYENIREAAKAAELRTEEALAELRGAGLELLYFSMESWKQDRRGLPGMMERLGLGIEGMHVHCDFPADPETDAYREAVDIAAEAGAGNLLIIPGIVAAYRYLFVPYILEDYPDLTPAEAMDLSAEMTRGHKWDLFVFHLSFILWGILTLITGMLAGIFYAWPYKALAEAVVYDDIRNEWEDRHA